MQNQVNLSGINNHDIAQCANAINRKQNVNLLAGGLEGGRWKNMGLFAHNVRTNISHDGCKGLPHNIMGCCPFLTMSVTKKVNPHEV
jgi:hypothetical protein